MSFSNPTPIVRLKASSVFNQFFENNQDPDLKYCRFFPVNISVLSKHFCYYKCNFILLFCLVYFFVNNQVLDCGTYKLHVAIQYFFIRTHQNKMSKTPFSFIALLGAIKSFMHKLCLSLGNFKKFVSITVKNS